MILQSLKMAWNAISSNKMRSFLTMLGIIIGVVALVVLVSLVTSATGSVTQQVENLGMNYITVGIVDDKGDPLRLSTMSYFTDNEEIAMVAPYIQTSATAKNERNNARAMVYGVTSAYFDIQGLELEYGRSVKTADVDNGTYIAVISQDTATELFDSTDVVGRELSLDGKKYTIVGVLAANDSSLTFSFGSDITVYIPYTTAVRMSDMQLNTVSSFYAAAADENNMDAAEEKLTSLLMDRFKNDDEAFSIFNMSILADAMDQITGALSLLLGGIAAISLLVGGIGIMNIMLVSVTERTREIGIRKAIGAGRSSIMMQFLIEALVVSMLGCLIGIIVSWIILQVVSVIAGDLMTFALSPGVVSIAVMFSTFIGLVFGLYPANKAASKHPIEALRYDG